GARKDHELPDGNVPADGPRLHRRSEIGPRLSRPAEEIRSRIGNRRLQGIAPCVLPRPCPCRHWPRGRRHRAESRAPEMSQPFFIVSSGRSGTAMMVKALSLSPDIQIKHEYAVLTVQPLAVRRHAGIVGAAQAKKILATTHGAAARLAPTKLWGDSS